MPKVLFLFSLNLSEYEQNSEFKCCASIIYYYVYEKDTNEEQLPR